MTENTTIHLRPLALEDLEAYYQAAVVHKDPEVDYYTGTKRSFTRQEIEAYVHRIVGADDRFDFLILDEQERILGEAVLNEIDWELRSCNFRICFFRSQDCGRGYGREAIAFALGHAFQVARLHRVSLEVYPFNLRAQRAYLRAGFRQEGILRDADRLRDQYCDIILMAILEEEYFRRQD